jgi:hypothetical protein
MERSGEFRSRRRVDQDRLADKGAIGLSRDIDVALTREFRRGSDKPAGQEAGDIEFLPGREIFAHHNGNFRLEAHEQGSEPVHRARQYGAPRHASEAPDVARRNPSDGLSRRGAALCEDG